MTADESVRYQQVKRIVLDALELQGRAREALIARETGGDPALAAEVRALLADMDADPTLAVSLRPVSAADDPGRDLSGQAASAETPRQYRLLRRLGAGGMGVVYLAERSDGGFVQKVALKLLNAVAETSPELRQRFARERELLARLDHPGIARLLDGGILADGRPFLAMEYVEGERIDTHAARLPLDGRIALFIKVCEAVADAHRCLVIHRDLKPANILVDAHGQPRLLDFGIARMVEDEEVAAAHTRTGQHALTLAYASPEQVACRPLTTATDVYSLGAVLYQLVCGQAPFANVDTPAGLYQAIARTDVPPPSRRIHGGKVSPLRGRGALADIDAIVLKALRKEPEQRYASVAALADDLRRYLQRRPVAARGGQRWYRLRRFLRRNAWPLAGAAVVALSVVAGLVASLHALRQARTQQAVAEQRGQQLQRIVEFQRSMLESVDIEAMGRWLVDAQQAAVVQADAAAGDASRKLDPARLERAFSTVGATDIARDALETYVVTHALDRIGRDMADAPDLAAELRESLARVLQAIGSNAAAEAQLRRVLEERRAQSPGSDGVLSAQLALASVLNVQGQAGEARALFEQVQQASASRPLADPIRLDAELGLATLMIVEGRFDDAIAAYDRIRQEAGQALAETDERIMRSRRYRADALILAGRRDEAATELESLLPLYRQVHGATHRDTLYVTVVQAKLLREQRRLEESQELARGAAEALARRYGEGHPETVSARYLVAVNEFTLSEDDQVLAGVQAEIERVIAFRRQQQGPDSAQTISPMTGLVGVLNKRADVATDPEVEAALMEQAITVQRAVLESHLAHRGADHPNTLLAQGSLAGLLHRQGRHSEALAYARRCLEGQQRVLDPDHPIIAATWDLIGSIESGLGKLEPAHAAYARALELRERNLGRQAPHTVESAVHVYEVLGRMQRRDEAEQVRGRYLDPVVRMDPMQLDAGMRSVHALALEVIGLSE